MKKETKKQNNFKTMRLSDVKQMFELDNLKNSKREICNYAILQLIDLINDNNKSITCEMAKSGLVLNRGSAVECLVKLLLNNQKSASKYQANKNDINLNGTGYEIKYTNSVAYGSFSEKQKTEYNNKQYKPLLLVNQNGIYLSNTEYYDICKNGKIKGVSKILGKVLEW